MHSNEDTRVPCMNPYNLQCTYIFRYRNLNNVSKREKKEREREKEYIFFIGGFIRGFIVVLKESRGKIFLFLQAFSISVIART